MAYISDNPLFRSLDDEEEKSFYDWAIENDPPAKTPWSILHPVCVKAWKDRGLVETIKVAK